LRRFLPVFFWNSCEKKSIESIVKIIIHPH